MPTLTTSYVYFGASGAHTRQPRTITSYGGFTPIPGLNPGPSGTLVSGTSYTPGTADPTEMGATLAFSFVNMSGCEEGPLTSYSASSPPTGTVGSDPISVLYVYIPVGGGPNGDTGAVIDAFDETSNSLVDNSFVTVTPDPGGTLTTEANVDGWVDTTDSGYTIVADNPNIGAYLSWPTTPLFDKWVDLNSPTPAGLISGANLMPGEGVTVYALAFYKSPVMKMPKEHFPDKPWRVKEWDKEHYKEFPDKNPADVHSFKHVVEKGGKEMVETFNPANLGDPGLMVAEMQRMQEQIGKLLEQFGIQGEAFIKPAERPRVGRRKRR